MSNFLKIILIPFSLFYGLIVSIRNWFFNTGIFSSTRYTFPVISIGNLSVGGTGKTPHTEFLINFLKPNYRIATLSRGYGRKTKGFKLAVEADTAKTIGDEPHQIFKKFDDIIVAVDEKRKRGIDRLLTLDKSPEIILLDDAFQHRKVKPGLSILLTDFSNLFIDDFMLPTGTLREPKIGAQRADIIVVTKSPKVLSPIDIRRISSDLKPKAYQKVFFSFIKYEKIKPLNEAAIQLHKNKSNLIDRGVLLVSAIANSEPLKLHLKRYSKEIDELAFRDHHFYKASDYKKINQKLNDLLSLKKAIVITEKDVDKFDSGFFKEVPVFYIPISIRFHENINENFTDSIINYVRSY